jgi:hypothetical protein
MASQAPAVHTDDVSDWTNRVKEVVNKPAILSDPRPAGAAPWKTDFFGCFDPIDTCSLRDTVPICFDNDSMINI